MDYLDSLNKPQREAVTAPDGPMLVIAGAGSGKTRVLTMRIAYLLSNGVMPYNILALTFTNKAAREMKERIAGIVGQQLASQLWMGTFHSLFARILRYESQYIGFTQDFTIYDTQDSKSLIKSIIKNMQLDDKIYKPSTVAGLISSAKNSLITPSMYAQNADFTVRDRASRRQAMPQVYLQYVNECRRCNAMDFDDLLLYTNVLLRDNPEVLARYQDKFKYVLVDEYQDTNLSQYVIIKRLVEKSRNICVVGDDAQSIYSFRGARIENILSFQKDYPDMRLYKLEQNYRSTQNIVNAANSIIKHNSGQIHKTVFSDNDEGDKVRIISSHSDFEEAHKVVNDIMYRMLHEHLQPSDFAILYRTNAQWRAFEEELNTLGLRYKVFGGLAFYQRKDVKDLLAYFRLAVNHNDNESLRRIINYPARKIGATTVSKIEQYAQATNRTLWNSLSPQALAEAGVSNAAIQNISKFVDMINTFGIQAENLDSYKFATEVYRQSGMRDLLESEKNDSEGKEHYDNISELIGGIYEFNISHLETGEPNNIRAYLEYAPLITDLDSDKSDERNYITLMTIHSSKGLEFNNVYIVGVEEDIFPGSMSIMNPQSIEEERRLFYVAVTRARNSVTISYALNRFRFDSMTSVPSIPSRFLNDVDNVFTERPKSMNVATQMSRFKFDGTSSQPRNSYSFSRTSAGASARPSASRFKPASAALNRTSASSAGDSQPTLYNIGDRVVHDSFGRGTVIDIEGAGQSTKLRIEFDNVGIKHLLLKFARLKPIK
ncbi:MAG: UvrD-helicase domain-containing protein [Bacteroidales bacterium]|nr:UvrD-helicase domain-containing protein [Bacteroidales bacterium]